MSCHIILTQYRLTTKRPLASASHVSRRALAYVGVDLPKSFTRMIELVATHASQGRTVGKVLESVGVARSSYYRWKKNEHGEKSTSRQSSYEITAEERKLIDEVKEQNPQYRHRRIQGMLQQQRIYLSASTIYGHLKEQGQIGPYERRAAPWKSPRYEVWQTSQRKKRSAASFATYSGVDEQTQRNLSTRGPRGE